MLVSLLVFCEYTCLRIYVRVMMYKMHNLHAYIHSLVHVLMYVNLLTTTSYPLRLFLLTVDTII